MAGTILRKVQHDGNLVVSTGPSRKSKLWVKTDITWQHFLELLEIPRVTADTVVIYHELDAMGKAACKDVGGYVGGQLQGATRGKSDVVFRSLICLDIENGGDLNEVWLNFVNMYHCAGALHTTHGHLPDKPRARLIVPLRNALAPKQYVIVSKLMADGLGLGNFDPTTHEPNRLMFWPSVCKDGQRDYVFTYNDAEWLDAAPLIKKQKELEIIAELSQEDPTRIPGLIGTFNKTYTIQDVIEKFLSDIYVPGQVEGRYRYAEASTPPGLVVYDGGRYCYSHHSNDPAQGKLCHSFDLVCIHKFSGDKLLTQNWIKEESLVDIEDVAGLTLNRKGAPESTVRNMRIILNEDERLAQAVCLDEFAGKLMVYGDFPWLGLMDRDTFTWTDADDAGLREFFETNYGMVDRLKLMDALTLTALQNKIHPVRQYIKNAKWDGEPRLDTLFINFLKAEDSAYVRAVTRKALIGAVARVFQPGCKHDHVLVLVGPQGCRKSTTISKLGQKWYTDSLYSMQGKEAYELLQGYWIIEMSEMAAARKSDIEQMKQFITKQSDNFRAAYDRRTIDHPRQCAFFGSTNDDEFLKDYTGNRRFWPINVDIVPEEVYNLLDNNYIAQVWAEAYVAFLAGEKWYLDVEMEKEAIEEQSKFEQSSPTEGIIEAWLQQKVPEKWDNYTIQQRQQYYATNMVDGVRQRDHVCAQEVWVECLEGKLRELPKFKAQEINHLLKKLGWKPRDCIRYKNEYGKQRGFVSEDVYYGIKRE